MYRVFIDNEEVVFDSNFSIEEEFMNPSSVILNKVYPLSWKGTDKLFNDYYFPKDYSKCKILKNDELYFVGIVKTSADMELNPFKPHYCSVQILDPSTFLSEGSTLDFVISDKNIEEAVNMVINAISDYGFVAGNINIPEEQNTLIGAYSTQELAPYDVFKYLSNISGTRWGTRMIDEDTTAIDFFSPETLDNMGIIEVTKEYCKDNEIIEIKHDYSTNDYRNKQIILSDEIFADINDQERLIGDGVNKSFSLPRKIGKISEITVNGNISSYASEIEKEFGITADFYYSTGSNTLEANADRTAPAQGSLIIVTYVPIVKGRQVVTNQNEINRITTQLSRKGVISRYETKNESTTNQELKKIAESYLKFKGNAEITITISSLNDFLVLGGKYNFNSPIAELNNDYLVKTKKTHIIQAGDFIKSVYEYELTNNFDTENSLNYFDNQRNKSNGNIEAGDFITRNIDSEDTANIIWFNNNIIEETIPGNNLLDCGLDSPFIN